MIYYQLAVWLVIAVATVVEGGNVLVYPFGHCLNSHLLNAEKLIGILGSRGHNMSMLVSTAYDGYAHRVGGYTGSGVTLLQFQAPANYKPICEYDTMEFMMYSPIRERFSAMIQTMGVYCDALLSDKGLRHTLKTGRFDLLIVESLDPCGKILADYLDIPFIPLMTTGLGHWDGNPRPASYLPAPIAPYTSEMSFSQRLGNFIMKTMYEIIPIIMGFEDHFQTIKEKHGVNISLNLADTFNRAALKLVNSNFAIDYPAPVEPDTVLIGGFAVDQAPPPLSRELENFVQSAGDHGVIVMSFGTLTKRFDSTWTKIFVDALLRVPQKIIWRYYPSDERILVELFNDAAKAKFRLMPWIPQASLLAHSQTRLFISHCGLNGMLEATHYGVPVLALPLSGDQMQNAVKLTQHLRMGVSLDMFSVDSAQIYDAVNTVLANQQYQINAQGVSQLVRDQPIDATSKLTFWVDYVIRHQGAPHLKSTAHKLTWFQYYCLDVICFIAVSVLAIISTIAFAILKLSTKLYIVINENFLKREKLKFM